MAEFLTRLLRVSLEGGALVLLVLFLRLVFRRAPAWTRPALWAVVLLRLLIPVELPLPSPFLVSSPAGDVASAVMEAAEGDDTAIRFLLPAGPTSDRQTESETVPAPAPAYASVSESLDARRAANEKSSVTPIFLTWAVGAAAVYGWGLVSLLRLLRRTRVKVKEGNVYLSDGVSSPFILGVFRPKIYLPSSLPDETKAAALGHEQAHIKRGDHIFKLVSFVLLGVYWFQPLMWLTFALLSRDIEDACDMRVVRGLDRLARADYAEALLGLSAPKQSVFFVPPAFGETNVKARVKAVLSPKKRVLWLGFAALAVISVAAVAVFLPGEGKMTFPDAEDGVVSLRSAAEQAAFASLLKGETDAVRFSDGATLSCENGRYIFSRNGETAAAYDLHVERAFCPSGASPAYTERWILVNEQEEVAEVYADAFSFSSRAQDFGTPPDFIAQAVTAAGLAGRSPVFTDGGAVYRDGDDKTYFCRAGEKPKLLPFLEEEGEPEAVFNASGWGLLTAAAEGNFVVTASESLFTGLRYTLVQAYAANTSSGAAALRWTALSSSLDSYDRLLLRDGRVWILGERKAEDSRSQLLVRCLSVKTGEVLFERAYGGSGSEKLSAAAMTDVGLTLFVSTDSADGDFGFAENGERVFAQVVLDENGDIVLAERMAKGAYVPPSPEGGVFDFGNGTDCLPSSGKKGLEITNTVPFADGGCVIVRRHVLGDYPYTDARETSQVFAEYIYTGYNAENTAVWQFASPVRVEMP